MYIHECGALFEAVQMQQIFPDGKTFPDCKPKSDLFEIVALFEKTKSKPGFDLKAFVTAHFDLPPENALDYHSDPTQNILAHIEQLWQVLSRPADAASGTSLLPLEKPYIVPGGRFQEIYYWDSYFTLLGLKASGHYDILQNMVDNFQHLIAQYGHIPNGNRAYYLSRSQPPFFALMVGLLAEQKGSAVFAHYYPALKAEYEFWMKTGDKPSRAIQLPGSTTLNRYWDDMDTPRPESYREDVELATHSDQAPATLYRHLRAAAESGWDFSSRWFQNTHRFDSIHTTEILPIDLNCLLWYLENTLSKSCRKKGDANEQLRYDQLALHRRKAIDHYFWDEANGFYFDYDFIAQQKKSVWTLAGVFPLFMGLASEAQAKKVAAQLENKFLKPGGLLTTLETTGQQWDAPNGWAPLQWIAYAGLKQYGFTELASEIKTRWLESNRLVYQQSGKMTEKYDVLSEDRAASGGEYPNQDGFGWTNGVFLAMEDA